MKSLIHPLERNDGESTGTPQAPSLALYPKGETLKVGKGGSEKAKDPAFLKLLMNLSWIMCSIPLTELKLLALTAIQGPSKGM